MKTFDHLLLLGLPAGGKSEFVDFMKNQSRDVLAKRYHLGQFEQIDDFVWLWEKCIEDDLWEEVGRGRLFSTKDGPNYSITDGDLYKFFTECFNREIPKSYLSRPEFYEDGTLIIEFSRGGDNTYDYTLNRLKPEILERAAIFYVQVMPEESRRRNEARYQEKLAHSILAHKTPDEVMDKFYPHDDWEAYTKGAPSEVLVCNGVKVPFVTMNNEPESTDNEVLAERYGDALDILWKLYNELKQ
ncbi:MAG: hypothetical protein KAT58_05905 [candidate division Zixibacteria bacterium]|nr:hypothetical protein [candidate division Zixibacteria bacterium]